MRTTKWPELFLDEVVKIAANACIGKPSKEGPIPHAHSKVLHSPTIKEL